VKIANVLYIAKIYLNLLSLAQLLRNGYAVSSKGNYCFTIDDETEISKDLTGQKQLVFDYIWIKHVCLPLLGSLMTLKSNDFSV